METAREWEAHYCAFAESLAPSGPVEGALVYRIALNFWRLGRLTKAETAAVSVSLAIEADHSLLSDNGSGSVERAREALELFNWWIESRDDESIDSEDAQTLLNGWPYEYDGDDELYERSSWTCGQLRQVFSQYAERDDKTPEAVLEELRGNLAGAIKNASGHLREKQTEAAQKMSRNLLPEAETLNRLVIYERHLVGMIRREFNQLERFQALRTGRPVVAPIEVGVTLSTAEKELGKRSLKREMSV